MKNMKKVMAVLLAGLILVAAAACNNNPGEDDTSNNDGGLIINPGLNDGGNNGTGTGNENNGDTGNNGSAGNNSNTNIDEANPTWVEKAGSVIVVSKTAVNIRKETNTTSDVLGTVKDGDVLTTTKYSDNWVCVTLEDGQTGYISRRRVVDYSKDLMDSFVAYESEITVIAETSISIRRYPSVPDDEKSHLVCGHLQKGDKVTCIAKGDGWYKVTFKTDAEGTVDPDGTETRDYYITANSKYVSDANAAADTTETDTDTGNEA